VSKYDWYWHILTGEPISLNKPLSSTDGRYELGDVLPDTSHLDPHSALVRTRVREKVRQTLGELGKVDRRYPYILRHRFGLDGADLMTLEELAQKLILSRERVRQLQNRALQMLRNSLLEALEEVEK